jgi:hypothetical protein
MAKKAKRARYPTRWKEVSKVALDRYEVHGRFHKDFDVYAVYEVLCERRLGPRRTEVEKHTTHSPSINHVMDYLQVNDQKYALIKITMAGLRVMEELFHLYNRKIYMDAEKERRKEILLLKKRKRAKEVSSVVRNKRFGRQVEV